MDTNEQLKRWGCVILYLALAGASCYWTEQSLALSLPKFRPEILIWILAIAFFIIASYGTKLIVDALNQDVYIDHRRRTFWIGITLTTIFWLLLSMPTNTHTLFYNSNIESTVQDDISTTTKYLTQIKNKEIVDSTYDKTATELNQLWIAVMEEFGGRGTSMKNGNGDLTRQRIEELNFRIEKELPDPTKRVIYNSAAKNSKDERLLDDYERQYKDLLGEVKLSPRYRASQEASEKANDYIKKLDVLNDTIAILAQAGEIPERVINQVNQVVKNGYNLIKENYNYVNFNVDTKNGIDDKAIYIQENPQTKIERQRSVYNTWIDFIQGKYPLSFLYAIFVALLVDVAAFMFFDFAFKKRQ
ncbi:MAG: hypothetical protein II990_02945 [Muribaculaceae bacterium]|nr:hypothetical protein [Muribaculaceae bacterium]